MTQDMLREISACIGARWHIGLNDHGVLPWIVVAAYGLAAALALRAAVSRAAPTAFWAAVAAVMAFLAVNKQLDFQTLATAIAHCTAKAQGWYEARFRVRLGILAAMAAAMSAAVAVLVVRLGDQRRHHRLALAGLAATALFIVIRAAASRSFAASVGVQVNNPFTNEFLELAGPVLVAANAVYLQRRHRRGLT